MPSITGELPEATSKYERKYVCRHRAHGREFRGTWSRTSSEQNLISWLRPEIRWFDDHNTEAAFGARYGRGRATKFPRSRPENFGAPRSRPEIPECSGRSHRARARGAGAVHHRRQCRVAPRGGLGVAAGRRAAVRRAQAAEPRAESTEAYPRRNPRRSIASST